MALEEYTPPLEDRIIDDLAHKVMKNVAKDAKTIVPHTVARAYAKAEAPQAQKIRDRIEALAYSIAMSEDGDPIEGELRMTELREELAKALAEENTQAPERAYRAWCILAGKGFKVPEFRAEFDSGLPVGHDVYPEDLLSVDEYYTNLHQAELAAVIEKVAAEIEAVDYGYQETPDFYSGLSEAATVVCNLTPPDATAALQAERDKAFNEGLEALYERLYSEFGHTSSWDLCVGVNDAVKREGI